MPFWEKFDEWQKRNKLIIWLHIWTCNPLPNAFIFLYKQLGRCLDIQLQASTIKLILPRPRFEGLFIWVLGGFLWRRALCVQHPSPLVSLFLPFQFRNIHFSRGPLDCFDKSIQKDQRESETRLVAFPFKAVAFRPCLCHGCLLAELCWARFDKEVDSCQADVCQEKPSKQMQFFCLCDVYLLSRDEQ